MAQPLLDSPSRGSEERGRTEPQPLATLGKDTGEQDKAEFLQPTIPGISRTTRRPQFPHPHKGQRGP